jgi:hypothetical protein
VKMRTSVWTSVVALSACVGLVAGIAQLVDYLTTRKVDVVLIALVVAAAIIPIVAVVRLWRKHSPGRIFKWDMLSVISASSAVVATVAVATIAIIVVITVTDSFGDSGGSTAKPSSTNNSNEREPPQVQFTLPSENMLITFGQDVDVAGTLRGIGDDTLWLVTKPDAGEGFYYLTANGPVARQDGDWSFPDTEVGDETDKGMGIYYLAVQANKHCADILSSTDTKIKPLPTGCTVRAERLVFGAEVNLLGSSIALVLLPTFGRGAPPEQPKRVGRTSRRQCQARRPLNRTPNADGRLPRVRPCCHEGPFVDLLNVSMVGKFPLLALWRLEPSHQLPRINLQHLGDLEDVVQADVAHASLHLADVRPVQIAVLGQLLLALAQLQPARPHAGSEGTGCF